MKLPIKKIGLFVAVVVLFGAGEAFAQDQGNTAQNADKVVKPMPVEPAPPPLLIPTIKSVRGIEIGMTVDQVREKLGKPDFQDKTGLVFSENSDSVQIGLDPEQRVRTVAAVYGAGSKSAPAFADIFGADDKEDAAGDVYKLERYPDSGFWVSYSRTNSADKPVVVVTLRKI